jgi:hypothetical protein
MLNVLSGLHRIGLKRERSIFGHTITTFCVLILSCSGSKSVLMFMDFHVISSL